jgi:hypothetical protein
MEKYNKRISELVKLVNEVYPDKRITKQKHISHKEILKSNINNNMRSGISLSIRKQQWWHWEDLVGYTLENLIKHLKKTMPKGYTWQDYLKGELHIDHIIPIRAFMFKSPKDKEFKQCWDLENLRLLPAKENEIKRDKITNPILLNLLINL